MPVLTRSAAKKNAEKARLFQEESRALALSDYNALSPCARASIHYTKMVLREHEEEWKVFLGGFKNPRNEGAHLIFMKKYKDAHPEEWFTFKARWMSAEEHVRVCEARLEEVRACGGPL